MKADGKAVYNPKQGRAIAYLLTIVFFLTFGCKPNEAVLSGQVFIVLKSRETLKLSLVEVNLIDKATAQKILTKRASLQNEIAALTIEIEHLSETNASISENIRLAQENIATSVKRENEYQEKAEHELSGRSLSAQQKILNDPNYLGQEYYYCVEQMKMWHKMGGGSLDNLSLYELEYNVSVQKQAEIAAQIKHLKSNSSVFEAVSAPSLKSCTTDSDGKFIMTVPGSEDYYLSASASRQTGENTEEYGWLVPVDKSKTTQIFLSNDNLLFP